MKFLCHLLKSCSSPTSLKAWVLTIFMPLLKLNIYLLCLWYVHMHVPCVYVEV